MSGPPGPFDVVVVGSGVGGLSVAVRLGAQRGPRPVVGVLTKGELAQSATRWAQGGVAAVLGGDEDSTDLHLADTLAAGAGLCDADAVRVLVDEGPASVEELIALGARFDRQAGGALALAREGGHSQARVVHAGGAATGAEVERALVEATRQKVTAFERYLAVDLLVEGGRCRGVVARGPDGTAAEVIAEHVVLATGGAGQLYAVTTNPPEATGDGLAMGLRAGVAAADVEFVQFHPTALHHPSMPRPLLSEALRGHGAVLRDAEGERFVDELAPRDVVSRAMATRMAEQGAEHLWLDATGLEHFESRFPTIAASLAQVGLDPSRQWLPIAPAAHHVSGGLLTDLWGATTLPGLWAVGETACTGVHGANRLASNSLLEGMVFGARLARALEAGQDGPTPTGALRPLLEPPGASRCIEDPLPLSPLPLPSTRSEGLTARGEPPAGRDPAGLRRQLQRAMAAGAGVVRTEASLAQAAEAAATVGSVAGPPSPDADPGAVEVANLATVARAVVAAASARKESRGAHTRLDHPEPDPAWRRRLVLGAPP